MDLDIGKKLFDSFAEAEKVATTHAVSVVMKPLRDALERLAEYKGGKGERWHDSAILNIEEATKQARKLNMMDDPALSTIFSEIDATMRPHYTAPELCKTDETTRAAAKQKVEDIMAKMGGIYGSV